MRSYRIQGNVPLKGSLSVQGNKNSALPCLIACLLTRERVVLSNIPDIQDVRVMLKILKCIGVNIEKLSSHSYALQMSEGKLNNDIPHNFFSEIRASILLVGAFLANQTDLKLYPPGGDVIGRRRLDTHINAFMELGVDVEINGFLHFKPKNMQNKEVFLEEASVTASENLIMMCVLLPGLSVLENVAMEPHVQDLCFLLVKMGANIQGIGTNILRIQGVDSLHGTEFVISPDYMEIGSFAGLAVMNKGNIRIRNVDFSHLKMIKKVFHRLGVDWIEEGTNTLWFPPQDSYQIRSDIGNMIPKVEDAPWPGFPADLTSILITLATQITGTLLIHEKLFESRLFFVDKLIAMGARIILCDPHRVLISGPNQLKAANITSPDVRAGMAMLLAALVAEGTTILDNVYQIERGYENIVPRLNSIGANIQIQEAK